MIERAVRAVVAVAALSTGVLLIASAVTVALAAAKPTGQDVPMSIFAFGSFAVLVALALGAAACHKDDAR